MRTERHAALTSAPSPRTGRGGTTPGRDDPWCVSKWRRWGFAAHTPPWAGQAHQTEEAPAGDEKDAAVPCSGVLPLTYQAIVRQAALGTISRSVYCSLSKGLVAVVEGDEKVTVARAAFGDGVLAHVPSRWTQVQGGPITPPFSE